MTVEELRGFLASLPGEFHVIVICDRLDHDGSEEIVGVHAETFPPAWWDPSPSPTVVIETVTLPPVG